MTRAECLEGSGPAGRAFFRRVLDLAEQQGHRINMGSSRFSIRKYFPKDQRYRTFAFCIPALTHSEERDEFQFFFGEVRPVASESEMQALREQLLGYGIFREAGELSLKAPVTQENLSLVNEIYDLVLERMDEMVAVHDGEQSG